MKKAFILGNPRSGTSLLRLMMNAHPHIVSPPESGFLHWWWKKYRYWTIGDSQSIESVRTFVSDVLESKKIETWNLDKTKLIQFIYEEQPTNYADLGACVYKMYALGSKKDPFVIIDKNNYYIHHLEDLNLIWSDAYYIYLVRDGRDVACSYLDMVNVDTDSPYKPKLPETLEDIAKEWNENNIYINNFLLKKNKKRWIKIRYEDLVRHPEKTLISITKLLDINFSEKMSEYYQYNDEPSSTSDWKRKTFSKPNIDNIGKYKSKLSSVQIKAFNKIAGESLKKSNYENIS